MFHPQNCNILFVNKLYIIILTDILVYIQNLMEYTSFTIANIKRNFVHAVFNLIYTKIVVKFYNGKHIPFPLIVWFIPRFLHEFKE